MRKKIIVKGKPELRKRICQCPNCDCQFYYTDGEIHKVEGFYGFVICFGASRKLKPLSLPMALIIILLQWRRSIGVMSSKMPRQTRWTKQYKRNYEDK
jgi:hypothetical protein|nr:MAG TPA: TMEM9 [Caudoviricetes sp.]